ncbi:NAD(P)H-binding protein [Leuconostoc falkenbergense]|uniref:NAD(P)H-binding protein n=1 Tax=Leuconostoc falkenbergense TaxID=2766470 RepID=UPI0024ADD7D6|nr:NAD(P)H-binding protein [Leuconostoc falkenbergense]MDI6666719.1 NAD(P)H-binding protein [Leuconostoc falkenbergense]
MNILIIGATGKMAQIVAKNLTKYPDLNVLLFARNPEKFETELLASNPTVVKGDALDTSLLTKTLEENKIDLVYSNLGGVDLSDQTVSIIKSMDASNVKRLIFISALGAHHEVPGNFGVWNEQAIAAYLPGFRDSFELLDKSDIDYTMVRPAWLTDYDEVNYETTARHEPFKGTEVSRKSVADFVAKVIFNPETYSRDSIGLNKTNTDGDKPSWL